jgi:SMC interacting uncharacterized protein involved in chromosome segregation
MIGCETNSGITNITRLEDFQDIVDDKVYQAIEEWVNKISSEYDTEVVELKSELRDIEDDTEDLDNENDGLRDTIDKTGKKLDVIIKSEMTREEIVEELKQIYRCM